MGNGNTQMQSYLQDLTKVLGEIKGLGKSNPLTSTKDLGRAYETWMLAQLVLSFQEQGFTCEIVDYAGNDSETLMLRGGPGFLKASNAGAVRVVGLNLDIVNSVMWKGTFSGNKNETDIAFINKTILDDIRDSGEAEPFCGLAAIECKYRTNPEASMGQGFVAEQLGRLHELWLPEKGDVQRPWLFATVLTTREEEGLTGLAAGVESQKDMLFPGANPLFQYFYLPKVRHAQHAKDAVSAGALEARYAGAE